MGAQGGQGNDGAAAAMQTISVGGQTFNSNDLTSVVFPGATATLVNGVLTLDSMRGEDGQDGSDAVVTGGSGGITVANGVVSNTKPCPDIGVVSGGITSTYLPTQLTAVRFLNCTHSYSSNILEITPIQSSGGGGGSTLTAGSGISITNDVISNTKQMAVITLGGASSPDVAVLNLNEFNTST